MKSISKSTMVFQSIQSIFPGKITSVGKLDTGAVLLSECVSVGNTRKKEKKGKKGKKEKKLLL